jgi:hypothetical protein
MEVSLFKKSQKSPGVVECIYNPSYLEGRYWITVKSHAVQGWPLQKMQDLI